MVVRHQDTARWSSRGGERVVVGIRTPHDGAGIRSKHTRKSDVLCENDSGGAPHPPEKITRGPLRADHGVVARVGSRHPRFPAA